MAGLTVPDDRSIHSLHGYFLRAGRPTVPTILHVDRDRDGRSYSARHVAARQDGEVIMSLLVSFHVDEDGREYQAAGLPEGVVTPDDAPVPDRRRCTRRCSTSGCWDAATRGARTPGGPHRFWARARGPLPDDRQLHACVLAYLSDIGTGLAKLPPATRVVGTQPRPRGLVPPPGRSTTGCSSTSCPLAAAGGRGFYTGTVHDRDGRLLATIAQEHVMRALPPRRQGRLAHQSVRNAPPSQRISAPLT